MHDKKEEHWAKCPNERAFCCAILTSKMRCFDRVNNEVFRYVVSLHKDRVLSLELLLIEVFSFFLYNMVVNNKKL